MRPWPSVVGYKRPGLQHALLFAANCVHINDREARLNQGSAVSTPRRKVRVRVPIRLPRRRWRRLLRRLRKAALWAALIALALATLWYMIDYIIDRAG